MSRAIGMIEFKTVSAGITAADRMVKTADVELLEAQTVCPGKYIALIAGDLSAVTAAVDTAKHFEKGELISSFVLGNPDESIFPAIYGSSNIEGVAADIAAKTADVKLIELRVAKGMCGKSYMLITGQVSDCQAAIDKAKQTVGDRGMFLDSSVIARPDAQICRKIV